MKTSKFTMLIVLAVLLNSCIIKSLQPFYTKKSISYTEKIIGNWQESETATWEIQSFKEEFKKDSNTNKKNKSKFSEGVSKVFNAIITKGNDSINEIYNNSYIAKYTKREKEAYFIAMPFKIDNQYFLDFIPFMYDSKDTSQLTKEHLIVTHSVAKLDIKNNTINLSWLDEDKIKDLFKANKLRLKHENIGIEDDLILTATSEELYAFLKKYITSNIEDKWNTSDRVTLTKTDAKP